MELSVLQLKGYTQLSNQDVTDILEYLDVTFKS